MASKVIAKLPVTPFGQVNKSKSGNVNSEVITVSRTPEVNSRNQDAFKNPEFARIAQLEQNVRFLQEQHQFMLAGLHSEIESLKNRNRELQFQLVFVKGSLPSSPSSPEDETKHKVYSSPKTFNITPIQVEILEKEMGEMKIQLQEAESRNVYLSAIVDEQKKKLERYERDREKERERAVQPDPELLRKLDDAEVIIRRLRRENSDLRRESSAQSAQPFVPERAPRENGAYQQRGGAHQNGRGQGRYHRGNHSQNHYNRGNWFPPLHTQSYWQGGRQNLDRNGMENQTQLPNLQQNDGQQQSYHGRRGNNNHNHEGRKHRQNKGGQHQKPPT